MGIPGHHRHRHRRGKTVVTAALAGCARVAGADVAVCKPVQTGTADGDDDLAEIGRLSGVRTLIGVARYPAPGTGGRCGGGGDCPCRRSPESSLPCGISMCPGG